MKILPRWLRQRRPRTIVVAAGTPTSRYGVRRDWPDGTHEFVSPRATYAEAEHRAATDREFWRRGPVRPTEISAVEISRRDLLLHTTRPGCRAPDCPTATAADRERTR